MVICVYEIIFIIQSYSHHFSYWIVEMIALPDMKERWATLGLEPVGNTPDEFAAQFRTELAKWAKVIREAGIKAQ
jgi:tripartite-type tricarboxylate transporter receptor subunit TctC